MSYRKAEEILPRELIEVSQQYVDGENIYIPRKLEHRKGWGERTQARQELDARNSAICLSLIHIFFIFKWLKKLY